MGKEQRLPITPGLPDHAEEVLYKQAGITRPAPATPEQLAEEALSILRSGETWHLPHELNGPAHDANRTGSNELLVRAIARARQSKM